MKRLLLSGLSLLFFFLCYLISHTPLQAQDIDQINSFTSDITINQDTSLTIQETIEYETSLDKHGIYRYIPLTYNQGGQKIRRNIHDIKVTDDSGEPLTVAKSADGKNLTLKIGEADVTFTGGKTYIITYIVDQAIRRFPEHDELFWDITGEGWTIPVAETRAVVRSAFAPIEKTACYSGEIGTDDQQCQQRITSPEQADFFYDNTIVQDENVTVVIGLDPNNQLQFPTAADTVWQWLQQNWILGLLPLPLIFLIIWWWRSRDWQFVSPNVFDMNENQPMRKKPLSLTAREPFVYEPLKDLTPGEAGALLNEKVDNQDVIAELLELARKHHLKIEVLEVKKLLGTDRDYQLTLIKDAPQPLTPAQQFLLGQLFIKGNVVKISVLKGTFYTSMQVTKQKIEQSLVNKHVYTSNPTTTRVKGFAFTFVSLGAVAWLAWAQFVPYQIYWPILVLLALLPLCLFLAYNLPQKSAVGTNLWLQARGLRKTIQTGKWREEIKEKHLFIEEVLPFAVALGVVDQLTDDMKELNIKQTGYLDTSALHTLTVSQFVSSFSSDVSSSLSYNPSSSHSSGGSGFSGGSSGGGGGGGGGGSW